MAKLKAPLLSLGASGAIGKAIVYFPWKGLNVAREYVIPANPKTTGQRTQRNYLTAAVAKIHEMQALDTDPMDETDTMAYALWGSTYPTPRTWFNQCVKNAIDQYKADKSAVYYHHCSLSASNGKLYIIGRCTGDTEYPDPIDVKWGTSKTALIHTQEITHGELEASIQLTDVPENTKIFAQLRPSAPAECIGAWSGIYYATLGAD
ncbi:hypothetical protein ES708_35134 [subsurface metagenome]